MSGSSRRVVDTQEPIGIVISRGAREEPVLTSAVYVWATAPVAEEPARGERTTR